MNCCSWCRAGSPKDRWHFRCLSCPLALLWSSKPLGWSNILRCTECSHKHDKIPERLHIQHLSPHGLLFFFVIPDDVWCSWPVTLRISMLLICHDRTFAASGRGAGPFPCWMAGAEAAFNQLWLESTTNFRDSAWTADEKPKNDTLMLVPCHYAYSWYFMICTAVCITYIEW